MLHTGAFERLRITGNARWRRTACFDACEHGIFERKAGQALVDARNRLLDRLNRVFGQAFSQIRPHDAGLIRWQNLAGPGGSAPGQKIAQKLCWRMIIAAAEHERASFKDALKLDAAQHIARRHVLGPHIDHEAAVCVRFLTRIAAHAVCHHHARLRSGRDDETAGTHTKTVGRTARAAVRNEFIRSGAKPRIPGPFAV